MKKFLCSLVVLLAMACASRAADAPTVGPVIRATNPPSEGSLSRQEEAAVRAIIARFFSALGQKEVGRAYDDLTRGSKLAEKEGELAALKTKTEQALEMFGGVIGNEHIQTQNVGSRLVRMTYLSIGRSYPLRWRFYFYKSDAEWHLIDIRVDDSLVRMFDEKAEGDEP